MFIFHNITDFGRHAISDVNGRGDRRWIRNPGFLELAAATATGASLLLKRKIASDFGHTAACPRPALNGIGGACGDDQEADH